MSIAGRFLVALALVLTVGSPAFAQRDRPSRPFRGLFGGAPDPQGGRLLDVSLSLYGAYDQNVLADPGAQPPDPRIQQSGSYAGAHLSVDYTQRTPRGTVDLSVGAAYRYLPSLRQLTGFNYWGSVGFAMSLSERTGVRLSEHVSYMPYFMLDPAAARSSAQTAGQIWIADTNTALVPRAAVSSGTGAALEHKLTERASVSMDYGLQYTDFRDGSGVFKSWSGGAGLGYRLTTRATARLGYHYRRGASGLYQGARPIEGHDLDFGVDYSRALSITRKTTFGFSTGSTAYRVFSETSGRLTTRVGVIGSAHLRREIGRSWMATLGYNRGLQFVAGLGEAFFTDVVAANLGGALGYRVRTGVSAAYTSGAYGLTEGGRNYSGYNGSVNLQVALLRYLALSASYFYYHYDFDRAVTLPETMNHGLSRQGAQVGLSIWLPLVR